MRTEAEIRNTTSWLLLGKRLSVEDMQEKYGGKRRYVGLIKHMRDMGINYACLTEYGNLLTMQSDDMTLDEYTTRYETTKRSIMQLKF